MLNFFSIIWFFVVGFSLYEIISNYQEIFQTTHVSKYFENNIFQIFWILPFYFINEIIFSLLVYVDRKECNKYIPKSTEEREKTMEKTHVIIPTYNVKIDDLRTNILNLKKLFHDRIWIADNGSADSPNQDLVEMTMFQGVHYQYYPVPNKTNAIYKTMVFLQASEPDAENVILLDDDTALGENFFVRTDLLKEPTTAGYCCNIQIDKCEEFNIWQNWIDFEYRTISFRNSSRNFHSLRFLHGIISVYRLNAAIEIFRWNPCNVYGLPFGEDAFAGLQARTVGYKLKHDHLNTVKTYCPKQLFNFSSNNRQGYNASSLFKQRALRWYLSWPRRIFQEFGLCFIYDTGSWVGNIFHRLDFLYYTFLLAVSVGWFYYFVYLLIYHETLLPFIFLHLSFIILTAITCTIRYSFMNESERENISYFTILTFPFFLLTLLYLYSSSFLVSIFYYIPFYRVDYPKCFRN